MFCRVISYFISYARKFLYHFYLIIAVGRYVYRTCCRCVETSVFATFTFMHKTSFSLNSRDLHILEMWCLARVFEKCQSHQYAIWQISYNCLEQLHFLFEKILCLKFILFDADLIHLKKWKLEDEIGSF